MSKHTPGPWLHSGRTIYALNDEGFNRFSALVQDAHAPAYELDANARLIAAAPDLLEALERIANRAEAFAEDETDMRPHSAEVIASIARAAIAKARGE